MLDAYNVREINGEKYVENHHKFIDEELARLDSQDPQLNKLKMRWKYLRSALLDMNSQSNALTSNSGRAFAPTTVDRHARALSNQWISLSQAASIP